MENNPKTIQSGNDLSFYLVFMRVMVKSFELRVQLHELLRHAVDASV